MTVSKVLNGVHVSAELTARVRAAAETLGYVPSVAAQSVRGAPTKTIGLLMNIDFDPHGGLMAVLDSLLREMESAGNQVLLSIARDGSQQIDSHLRGFLGRRVDGVFYWNVEPSKFLDLYERAGIPVLGVAFRDPACEHIPMISVDVAATFTEMYDRLFNLGHRRGTEVTTGRSPVIHEAFGSSANLRWTSNQVGFDRASIVDFVRSIRGTRGAPTVILTDYPIAVRVLEVCDELGIEVPGDLSVVSIMDALGANMLRTPLSCVRTDYEALGHAAAQAMLAALDGIPLSDVQVRDCTLWIERSSTGPARES
ncbi:MAG: transcriptional regulator, LacI family [Ilumatobacteraceae bacterium]|nr:transcriptional regulator, LacI family [Ilumatobacteraceae bacterium]